MGTTKRQQRLNDHDLPTPVARRLIAERLLDQAARLLLVADGRLPVDGDAVAETPAQLRATAARLQALAIGLDAPTLAPIPLSILAEHPSRQMCHR